MIVLLLLVLAGLSATHEDHGSDVRLFAGIVAHAMFDELRGAPSAAALQETRRFEQDGIAFDHPAVLRVRLDDSADNGRSWNMEYRMFKLELMTSDIGIDGATYLGTMADLLAGGRSLDAQGPMRGRTAMLCGEERTATRIRVKLLGDWSTMEAFDLPPLQGRTRTLVFDDEDVRGGQSALARATYERVLGSLQCTESDETASADSERRADTG